MTYLPRLPIAISLLFALAIAPLCVAQVETPAIFTVIIEKNAQPREGVFAIKPITSWQGAISFAKAGVPVETVSPKLQAWVASSQATNGLTDPNLHPWHAVIQYQLFDEDGDMAHSGTIDEVWATPKQYRIQYSSDALNQTDYATEKGLFRTGDQRWPNPLEISARITALSPFADAAETTGIRASPYRVTIGFTHTFLHCSYKRHRTCHQ